MNQINPKSPARHRVVSNRTESHRCPHCSKQYKISTWLENHVKIKHSTRGAQDQPKISTDVSTVRHHESSQGSNFAALVNTLRKVSSILDQFIPLINDVTPLLQELKEVSSKSDQGYLHNLKRRASSPDLREGEGIKRKNISTHSPEVISFQEPGSVRSNVPENWKSSPVAPLVDNESLTANGFDYSSGFASHSFPRNSQKSQLLPSQGNITHSPILDSEPLQQQLHIASIQVPELRDQADNTKSTEQASGYQHKRSPIRHGSAWIPLSTSKPVIDAQLLQEPSQHQSMMQTMRHPSDSSPFRFQEIHDFDGNLQDCGIPDPFIADSVDEFSFPGQLVANSKGGDDLLFDVFDV